VSELIELMMPEFVKITSKCQEEKWKK